MPPLQIIGLGDAVVDRYLDRGVMFPGGSACNVAVYARRLGLLSGFLGGISEDGAGSWILHALEGEDVDISEVQLYAGEQAYADVRIAAGGGREFGAWRPTPVPLDLTPARLAYLSRAAVVHTSYSGLLDEHVQQIASLVPVSFDFSYKDLDYAGPLLPHVSGAFFSRAELAADEAVDFVREMASRGPRLVVATRGDQGSVVLLDGELIVQSATEIDGVIDTLGAGDAFAARMLTGLIRRESAAEAAQGAADYAASVCAIDGAFGWAIESAREAG